MKLLSLIIVLSIIHFGNTVTSVVLVNDFAASTFSSSSSWSISSGTEGYTLSNSKSVFGGPNYFGVSTQILKLFQIPNHYQIRVYVTIYTFGKWDNGEMNLFCEDQLIASQQLYTMKNPNHVKKTSLEVIAIHNARTVIIQIRPTTQVDYGQSWGIRDFKIEYISCPTGCSVCSIDDLTSCSQWTINYQQFTLNDITIMNHEGWFVMPNNGVNYVLGQCSGVSLFGIYSLGTILRRQFYFDRHTKMRIIFLFQKMNDWGKSVLNLYVDGVSQLQISDTSDKDHNFNYCDSDSGLDQMMRYDIQFDHSLETSEFILNSTTSFGFTNSKFGIRDIQIFVSCQSCQLDPKQTFQTPISYFTGTLTDSTDWMMKYLADQASFYNCSATTSASLVTGDFTILGRFASAETVSKTYKLSPHRRLIFTFKLDILDSWDQEYFYIEVDGILVSAQQFVYSEDLTKNFCSNLNYADQLLQFSYALPNHNQTSITIKLYSNLDEDQLNESFGIASFRILLGDCPFNCAYCNDVTGDYCQFVLWDEYWNLKNQYFTYNEGWGGYTFNNVPTRISSCNFGNIFGGYIPHQGYITLTKTLAAHTKLKLIIPIYIIGQWNNDKIIVTVNGQEIYSKAITSSLQNSNCLSNIGTFMLLVEKVIVDSLTTLVIKITNDITLVTQDNRSFGVRNVNIYNDLA